MIPALAKRKEVKARDWQVDMKKTHLFGIVVIGLAIFIIISTAGDASTYVTFKEANEMAMEGDQSQIHVVGKLKKDDQGKIIEVQSSADKLSFSFTLIDENNKEQTVVYNEPMPADFLRSEQVVVVGSFQNQQFIADKILMKCPSKYVENKIEISSNQH